jgi:DNA mismatch endonuclease, patch repair protein
MTCNISSPSFLGLASASQRATKAARGSSTKNNTRCELLLRRELWRRGLRYRVDCPELLGRPDIVFFKHKLVVFCDGDFWHGRDLEARLARLRAGHNAPYWVTKIRTNVERDRAVTARLRAAGWHVMRAWETNILRDPNPIVDRIAAVIKTRLQRR